MSARIEGVEYSTELGAESGFRFRPLRGPARWLQFLLGASAPLSGLAFILDLPYSLTGTSLFPQQYLGLFLGLVLAYVFLSVPLSPQRHSRKVPWYDWLLVAISLVGGLYVAVFYGQLLIELGQVSALKVLLGSLLVLALLEATRRLTSWPLVVIALLFILYGRFGYLLPGLLAAKETSWPRLINQLYLSSEFLFGTALQTAGLVVLSFVILGQFLFGLGGADFFLNLAQAAMGRYRGGPAKIAVVASGLFGGLSSSAVANVAAIGTFTIPLMKRAGYPAYFAGAVEAVSSTGDCIIPPIMGATAFVMAELLGLPYYQVALTAIVPALLYYLGEFIQIDLRAAKEGLGGIAKEELPSLSRALKAGWVYLVPVGVLIYGLFGLHLRAELAATYALASLLLVAIWPAARSSLKEVPRMLEGVTRSMLEVTVVCGIAGLMIGVVTFTGLGPSFARILTSLGGGNLLLVALLTAAASIVLGMGMPMTASYLFLAVLAAPAMVGLGVPPLLAHLFILYFAAYSFLTPPVCLAVYTAASIARAPMLQTAWQAMKLAAAGYIVPFIFIYKPEMVLMGPPLEVALAIIDSLLAVAALAVAAEGYFRRPLGWLERVFYLAASLAFFVPGWSSRLAGLALLALLLAYNLYRLPHAREKALLDYSAGSR